MGDRRHDQADAGGGNEDKSEQREKRDSHRHGRRGSRMAP
jgi:hypothetical protein